MDLYLPECGDLSADLVRRARIAEPFVTGDLGVELETYGADQDRERLRAHEIAS